MADRCVCASWSGTGVEAHRVDALKFIWRKASVTAGAPPGVAPGVAPGLARPVSAALSSRHLPQGTGRPSVTINGVGPCKSQ